MLGALHLACLPSTSIWRGRPESHTRQFGDHARPSEASVAACAGGANDWALPAVRKRARPSRETTRPEPTNQLSRIKHPDPPLNCILAAAEIELLGACDTNSTTKDRSTVCSNPVYKGLLGTPRLRCPYEFYPVSIYPSTYSSAVAWTTRRELNIWKARHGREWESRRETLGRDRLVGSNDDKASRQTLDYSLCHDPLRMFRI
jgi:hypothetical protein